MLSITGAGPQDLPNLYPDIILFTLIAFEHHRSSLPRMACHRCTGEKAVDSADISGLVNCKDEILFSWSSSFRVGIKKRTSTSHNQLSSEAGNE